MFNYKNKAKTNVYFLTQMINSFLNVTNENELSWPPILDKTSELAIKLTCVYCNKILVNVHQADDCGCRYCFDCLEKMYTEKQKKCPACQFNFASNVRQIV